ncbi:MAG: AmmeMemoRadiSam system protein A [Hydrogenovibrio sp.]|nr:AmmeMemoRadiSam system protein A [Hydrogenovibrio sp.]
MTLTRDQQNQLFRLIKQTLLNGVSGRFPTAYQSPDEQLNCPGASFVTLHLNGQLRGCIGSLQAHRPLADDIVQNAFSAAFRDPRFAPVTAEELQGLQVEFSILTEPEPIPHCETKQALMDQLVPFEDGLILSDGMHRATFLPSVWTQLPEKEAFIDHLMHKGGMTHWSSDMRCERYGVVAYERDWQAIE